MRLDAAAVIRAAEIHAQKGVRCPSMSLDAAPIRGVQIPPRAHQRLAPGPGPGASAVAGQRTSPVGHPDIRLSPLRRRFLLVDERCASQSPKSRRVRRAIN
jgi:hypothetical protein